MRLHSCQFADGIEVDVGPKYTEVAYFSVEKHPDVRVEQLANGDVLFMPTEPAGRVRRVYARSIAWRQYMPEPQPKAKPTAAKLEPVAAKPAPIAKAEWPEHEVTPALPPKRPRAR